jgi:hypothetical protein
MNDQPPQAKDGGLRGSDKRQGDLTDQQSSQQEKPTRARTPHRDAQPGAAVAGLAAAEPVAIVPEGLQRERTGPLDKNRGRNAPDNPAPKE